MNHINFFASKSELANMTLVFDDFVQRFRPEVHLFSHASLAEFGAILILEFCLVTLFIIFRKKIISTPRFLLFLISIISVLPIFLFKMSVMPAELYRFGVITNIFGLLYLTSNLKDLLEIIKLPKNKLVYFTVLILLALQSIPGVYYLLEPVFFSKEKLHALDFSDKGLYTLLKKYRNRDEVILMDETHWKKANNKYVVPYLAGYYGVSGFLYTPDLISTKRALQDLNPNLLRELNVDKVLLTQNLLNKKNIANLNNKKLFKQVSEIRNKTKDKYFLFEFLKDNLDEINKYEKNYSWTIGMSTKSKDGYQFIPVSKIVNIQDLIFKDRTEAQNALKDFKNILKKSQPSIASVLRVYAI